MRLTLVASLLFLTSGIVLGEDAKKPTASRLSKKEAADGFVRLFDGKTLNGWQGAVNGYKAEKGVLVCLKESGGKLLTTKEYGDFIFRFEFKLEPGANNGIGLRAPLEGDPAYTGMEIQVLDDDHESYKSLRPYQYHGSIYGVVAAKRGHLKPTGQWNSEEIYCKGRHVKVTLNGTLITEAVNLDAYVEDLGGKTIDGHAHPGLKREKGYIGLLGHGARLEFRNLRIKEL